MGSGPISSPIDTGGGSITPDLSAKSSASSTNAVTGPSLGPESGPVFYFGNSNPITQSSNKVLYIVLAVIAIFYFALGRR